MRRLMTFHRYLSSFVAPAMIFFAVSGAWQAFRLQDARKDGSYTPPPALVALSHVHKAERLSGAYGAWLRTGQLVLAAAFVATALAGLAMAFRAGRGTRAVWLCVGLGIVVPVALALLGHG